MNTKEQIKIDMVIAMKAKDQVTLNTLRSISTAFTNAEKTGKDFDEMSILKTLAKQRKQSIDAYVAAGNQNLADLETSELLVIEKYLPTQMTADQIREKALEMFTDFDVKKMGMMIGQFNKQYSGQDGKLVADTIKSMLV